MGLSTPWGGGPFTLTESSGAVMSNCSATGERAVAEGSGATAGGICSHAEGKWTYASGGYSHAEGNQTRASGSCSHAEGWGTSAITDDSHAEGSGAIASGDCSHAEGSGATAGGICSHAEGCKTLTTTYAEHASGYYNNSLSGSSNFGYSGNTLFTVGNGASTGGSSGTRHNAFQIMQDGTIYIVDTSGSGYYYNKPMIKLQEIIKDLQNRVATLEANEVTKTEVEQGFNNVITVVDDTELKIKNDALEGEALGALLDESSK